MPAKKMKVRAKKTTRKRSAPFSGPSCDPKTGRPRAARKTKKK